MKKVFKEALRIVLLFLLICGTIDAFAQDDTANYEVDSSYVSADADSSDLMVADSSLSHNRSTVLFDSSSITVRHMRPEDLRVYKNDPDFNYLSTRRGGSSIIDRFFRWISQLFSSVGRIPLWSGIFKFLLYGGCAALIIFAVIRIVRTSEGALTRGSRGKGLMDYEVMQDDIYGIDFNKDIQEAIANKQFRLAIRLLYLKSLRSMADKELIDWKINKTNTEYLDELRSEPLRQPFSQLTRIYEYVWYGELPVNETQFQVLYDQFTHFSTGLK